jgi:hypothetical protein
MAEGCGDKHTAPMSTSQTEPMIRGAQEDFFKGKLLRASKLYGLAVEDTINAVASKLVEISGAEVRVFRVD